MAERNHIHDAVALRARESPAGARILTLMTRDAGLVDVFVFGGAKSKLRSLASPYIHGTAYVYADPVKDYRTLRDFEVVEPFSGLRESLERLQGAAVASETTIRTAGGAGEPDASMDLLLDALRELDGVASGSELYPVMLFLWRQLGTMGLQPDLSACLHCGALLLRDAWLDPSGEGLSCGSCAPPERAGIIPAGSRTWLAKTEGKPFHDALAAKADASSLAGLRALVFPLARRAAEGPLYSLEGY